LLPDPPSTPTASLSRTSVTTVLAALPVACAAATGTSAGGATLVAAGLIGLGGLTLVSERWRRAARRDAAATLPETGATTDPAPADGCPHEAR